MLNNRVKTLQKILKQEEFDALLVSSAVNIEYLTGYPNFSKAEREAYLFITQTNATLFTDPRYIEAVEKIIPSDVEATINKPASKFIGKIVLQKKLKRIGFETNFTVYELERIKKVVKAKFSLADDLVESLREIKDADEINKMQKAAKLTDGAFEYIKNLIQIGVSEKQIAWEMEKFIKENGGTLAFDSIVAFGANSSIPHHIATEKKLTEKDEFVLLDFGAKVDGYCCDMTRTILTSNTSARAKKIYRAVLEAQEKAGKSIVADKKDNALTAAKIANEALISYGFKKVPHGLGHGIGLEVHEKPHLHPEFDDILTNGMVFSIEPGVYIPGFGGVRIEDTAVLIDQKLVWLTKSAKTLDPDLIGVEISI